MTIDQLRREKTLQAHHWLAAKWYVDQFMRGSPVVRKIKDDCRHLERVSACYGIDSFRLLNRAAVSREPLLHNERVIGVLRETLNMVDRMMRHEGRMH